MKKLIIISSLLFLTSACSSLTVVIPGPEIETPMTSGDAWNFDMDLRYNEGQGVEVTEEPGARPPDLSSPRLVERGVTELRPILGLSKKIDVGMGLGITNGASFYFKLQVLGEPYNAMKASEFSLALHASSVYGSSSKKGDQAVTFGPGGFPWSASVSGYGTQIGLSTGYNFTDSFFMYGGVSRVWYRLKYSISHDQSTDGSSPAANYTGNQKGSATAAGIGVGTLMGSTSFNINASYAKRIWQDAQNRDSLSFGAGFRFLF